MKINLFILLFASLIGCEQCEDNLTELEKLPPATQEGKNTFGCLVNGKAWVPKTSIDAAAFYQGGLLSIGADLVSPDQSIGLSIYDEGVRIATGDFFELGINPTICRARFFDGSSEFYCYYSAAETISGKITISNLDEKKFVVSGQFEFVTNLIGCDTIKITHGRFDLHYAP
ncbi:MAG: hypothetical protein ACOYXT_11775, partial [Bacteroidota bacterium]